MRKLPPIVGLNGANEAFQKHISCPIIFLPGCNMRCPYCLNTDVVLNQPGSPEYGAAHEYSWDEIRKYLRDNQETHVMISGGEPCLSPDLGNLVDELRELGMTVGLSTNGCYSDVLDEMVRIHGVEMVAMDVKCDPHNSDSMALLFAKSKDNPALAAATSNILDSIKYLNGLTASDRFSVEYRTTMYPPAVLESDIQAIGKLLSKRSHWVLQQFRARLGLLGGDHINGIKPYDDATIERWEEIAKTYVPSAELRWP